MLERTKGIGVVLILLGGFFLISQFVNINIASFVWPFFILIPGLLMLAAAFFWRESSGLAVPGSIVSMVGLILFFQNFTGRFETWSYLWALMPVAVGIGLFMQGNLTNKEELQHNGSRTITTGLILLAAFAIFFELLIFNNFANSFIWRYVLPVVLIGGGAYFLVVRQGQNTDLPPSPSKPEMQ